MNPADSPTAPRPARFQFGLRAMMASVLWLGFCGSLVAIFGSELRWLGGIGIFAWVISVWLALCFDLPEQNDFPESPRPPRLQFSLRGLMSSVLWLGFCAAMVVLGCSGPGWLCGLGFFGAILWGVRVWFTYVNDRPITWSPSPESFEAAPKPHSADAPFQFSLRALMAWILWLGLCGAVCALTFPDFLWLCVYGAVLGTLFFIHCATTGSAKGGRTDAAP